MFIKARKICYIVVLQSMIKIRQLMTQDADGKLTLSPKIPRNRAEICASHLKCLNKVQTNNNIKTGHYI